MGELLITVRDYYEASAANGGISLVAILSAEPLTLELDRSLMLRAVSNMVSTAIVRSPPGGAVTLAASSDDVEMRIKISDTGSGIPAEALPRVFDRYFRVDPSRSKNSGGTGLGLAIVQSNMTLHGGKAEITCELGHGTCVTLRIPTRAAR